MCALRTWQRSEGLTDAIWPLFLFSRARSICTNCCKALALARDINAIHQAPASHTDICTSCDYNCQRPIDNRKLEKLDYANSPFVQYLRTFHVRIIGFQHYTNRLCLKTPGGSGKKARFRLHGHRNRKWTLWHLWHL